MKKIYIKPDMRSVRIEHQHIICNSDPVRSVNSGEAGIGYGGGSSTQSARVKSNTVDWDDDWSE